MFSRVAAGIPRYGVDFSADNLLLKSVSKMLQLHKGCYLGQEVVEAHPLAGHVNRKLCV